MIKTFVRLTILFLALLTVPWYTNAQNSLQDGNSDPPGEIDSVQDDGIIPNDSNRKSASGALKEAQKYYKKGKFSMSFRKNLEAWQIVNSWRPSARTPKDRKMMQDAINQMKDCSEHLHRGFLSEEKALVLHF